MRKRHTENLTLNHIVSSIVSSDGPPCDCELRHGRGASAYVKFHWSYKTNTLNLGLFPVLHSKFNINDGFRLHFDHTFGRVMMNLL